jgi:ABC-type lipoprotein export system ATPase subunit
VLTLLRRLNDEFGKTIVMVTHDAHAAERATTVLQLDKGVFVGAASAAPAVAMPASASVPGGVQASTHAGGGA